MTTDPLIRLVPHGFFLMLNELEARDRRRRFDEARQDAYYEYVQDLAERTVRGKDEHEVRVYVPPHVYDHMWEVINRLKICSSSGYREMRFFVVWGTVVVRPQIKADPAVLKAYDRITFRK